jgi:N-acetylglucosamine-6-phosphate deacetylase
MRPRIVRIGGRLARAGKLVDGWLEIRGHRLSAVELGRAPRGAERQAGIIAPGLCDLQVNGAAGMNVTDGLRALDAIDAVQLHHGVTSYLPTVISTFEDEAATAVAEIGDRVGDPRSPVAGIHLEGPFLNPRYRGVHRAECLAAPPRGEPAYYGSPHVRLVTLAPELPGALQLVSALTARGVTVSIGHTSASAGEAEQAAVHGAACVTHLFNAMKEFHHRRPNVPGWALAESRVRVGVIADGFHVDPLALRLVARLAGRRAVLITDASPAAGADDGVYRMAGVEIHSEDGRVRDATGGLAGSALTLDEAVRRWTKFAGVSLAESLAAASERPARLVGLETGLRAGAPADLVVLTETGAVERVMRRGVWVR